MVVIIIIVIIVIIFFCWPGGTPGSRYEDTMKRKNKDLEQKISVIQANTENTNAQTKKIEAETRQKEIEAREKLENKMEEIQQQQQQESHAKDFDNLISEFATRVTDFQIFVAKGDDLDIRLFGNLENSIDGISNSKWDDVRTAENTRKINRNINMLKKAFERAEGLPGFTESMKNRIDSILEMINDMEE